MADEDDRGVSFDIQVPDDLQNGQYANFMSVWSQAHEFTLDFAVTHQSVERDGAVVVPTRVVARIKIPLTMAEDVLRALATQVTQFEEQAGGRIKKPGEDKPSGEGGS